MSLLSEYPGDLFLALKGDEIAVNDAYPLALKLRVHEVAHVIVQHRPQHLARADDHAHL